MAAPLSLLAAQLKRVSESKHEHVQDTWSAYQLAEVSVAKEKGKKQFERAEKLCRLATSDRVKSLDKVIYWNMVYIFGCDKTFEKSLSVVVV